MEASGVASDRCSMTKLISNWSICKTFVLCYYYQNDLGVWNPHAHLLTIPNKDWARDCIFQFSDYETDMLATRLRRLAQRLSGWTAHCPCLTQRQRAGWHPLDPLL